MLGFILLTAAGQAFLLFRSGATSWRDVLLLPHPVYLLLALAGTAFEAVLAGARLMVFGRVHARAIGFWTYVRANLSAVFSMSLTPGGVGGGPTQIFVLHKGGMPVADAAILSVASFFTTLLAMAAGGVAAAWLGGAAVLREHPAMMNVFRASGIFCVFAGTGLVLLLWRPHLPSAVLYRIFRFLPDRLPAVAGRHAGPSPLFRRTLRAIRQAQRTVTLYVRRGRGAFLAALCLAGLIFFNNCLQAYWVVKALGSTASFAAVAGVQIPALLLGTYSPSPGGSGVAEVGTALMMGSLIDRARIPLYVLLWRTVVFYLLAAAGGILLAMTLRRKKG